MNCQSLYVVACPVFRRELETLLPRAKTSVTLQFLDMGLHEGPADQLRAALQAAIDNVPSGSCDAIALAYGLCNRGIVGLRARSLPVVIPRAHDCIGMLLGSSQCYLAQLESQPGTYFQSPGWLENSPANGTMRPQDPPFLLGSSLARENLVKKFGRENAEYVLGELAKFSRHYKRLAFIATPVPGLPQWEQTAREMARARNWSFERLVGDLGWLERLLNGQWNESEFLVLQPGESVGLRYDSQLIGPESV